MLALALFAKQGYYMYYDEAGKEPFVEVDLEPTAVEYSELCLPAVDTKAAALSETLIT